MNAPAPRRRWLRRAAVVVALAIALLAFGAWRFAGDRERVATFIAQQARDALGVEVVARGDASLDWWPAPGLRLEDVVVNDASGHTLLSARSLAARVPWSALWSRELHLRALEADGARIDIDAVSRIAAARRDDGPPAPLRWPRLDAALVLRDAVLVRADGGELHVDFELAPLAPGAPVDLRATVAHAAEPAFTATLAGIARERSDGLAIEDARITLMRAGDATPVAIAGVLAFAGAGDWSFDGNVASAALPAWSAAGLPAAQGAPAQLQLRLANDAGRVAVRVNGTLAGTQVDADVANVELPAAGGIAALLALAASGELRGSASIDRIAIGDVVLEGVRYEAAPPPAEAPAK